MIGFGELRKLSVQWQLDIAQVEQVYATDCLLKGIFDTTSAWILRGSAALCFAHLPDDALLVAPEFWAAQLPRADDLQPALQAASASGVKFSLADLNHGAAKIEFLGPLGRRSAAQPSILLTFVIGQPPSAPVRVPLIHRFSDECRAAVIAEALPVIAAQRIAQLGATPTAREVYEAWLIITRAGDKIDGANRPSVQRGSPFNLAHRLILQQRWDVALARVPHHPTFTQVESDLAIAFNA